MRDYEAVTDGQHCSMRQAGFSIWTTEVQAPRNIFESDIMVIGSPKGERLKLPALCLSMRVKATSRSGQSKDVLVRDNVRNCCCIVSVLERGLINTVDVSVT